MLHESVKFILTTRRNIFRSLSFRLLFYAEELEPVCCVSNRWHARHPNSPLASISLHLRHGFPKGNVFQRSQTVLPVVMSFKKSKWPLKEAHSSFDVFWTFWLHLPGSSIEICVMISAILHIIVSIWLNLNILLISFPSTQPFTRFLSIKSQWCKNSTKCCDKGRNFNSNQPLTPTVSSTYARGKQIQNKH